MLARRVLPKALSVRRALGSGVVVGVVYMASRHAPRWTPVWCDETVVGASAGVETRLVTREQRSIWHKIAVLLRRHVLLLVSAACSAGAAALLSVALPACVARAVDLIVRAISEGQQLVHGQLGECIGIMLAVSALNAAFTLLSIRLTGELGERVAWDLRGDLFDRLLHETVAFHDAHSVAELLAHLSADVQDFKHALKQLVLTGTRATVQVVASATQMYLLSPRLSLSLAAGLSLVFAVGSEYGRFLRGLSEAARRLETVAEDLAHDALLNVRTVKAFSAEECETARYCEATARHAAAASRLHSHIGLFQGLTTLSLSALVAGVLRLGGTEASEGRLTSGGLVAFLMSLQTAQKALAQCVSLHAKTFNMIGAFARIDSVARGSEELRQLHAGHIPTEPPSGRIALDGAAFIHRGRTEHSVLRDANLMIDSGDTVAIVGESGCGKSSLAALLERFYDVTAGRIAIDGHDVRTLDLKWLRSLIGFVPQEPTLLRGSILENIRYGSPDASMTAVVDAARQAHLHDFVSSLPRGYATEIGPGGVTLSGGQKQRVALARALLRNPRILILDEATSALDPHSERIVRAALKEAIQGRTVIIITHNHEQLSLAKHVYMLVDGKFVKVR